MAKSSVQRDLYIAHLGRDVALMCSMIAVIATYLDNNNNNNHMFAYAQALSDAQRQRGIKVDL